MRSPFTLSGQSEFQLTSYEFAVFESFRQRPRYPDVSGDPYEAELQAQASAAGVDGLLDYPYSTWPLRS